MTKLTRSEQSRINGAKSRGPVTAEGKARSARNATKHSKFARPDVDAVHTAVLRNESLAGFTGLLARRCQDLRPANSLEIDLVRELCDIEWRMDRCKAIETRSLNLQLLIEADAERTPEARKLALPIDYTCAAYSDLLATSEVLQFCSREFRHLQKARTETLNTFLRLRKQPKFFAQSKEPETFQQLDNWSEPEPEDDVETGTTPPGTAAANTGPEPPTPQPPAPEPAPPAATEPIATELGPALDVSSTPPPVAAPIPLSPRSTLEPSVAYQPARPFTSAPACDSAREDANERELDDWEESPAA